MLISESAVAPRRDRSARRANDVGDIRRQFHDDRNPGRLYHPSCDLLAVLGHLANGRAHSAFAHSVRAAVVQFNAVRTCVFDPPNDVVPGFGLRFDHGRNNNSAIRPGTLHLRNLAQIDFEGPVGNQFDVVDCEHSLPAVMPAHRSGSKR